MFQCYVETTGTYISVINVNSAEIWDSQVWNGSMKRNDHLQLVVVAMFSERSMKESEGPQLRDSNKNERSCWSSKKEGRGGEGGHPGRMGTTSERERGEQRHVGVCTSGMTVR